MRLRLHPTWTHAHYWTTHLLFKRFLQAWKCFLLLYYSIICMTFAPVTLMENKYTFVLPLENIQCIFFPFRHVIKWQMTPTYTRYFCFVSKTCSYVQYFCINMQYQRVWTMYIGKTTHWWVAWLLPCCLFFSVASTKEYAQTNQKDACHNKNMKNSQTFKFHKSCGWLH